MKALLIGIDRYEDGEIEPLRYAVADVLALAGCLRERCGCGEGDVTVLADHPRAAGLPTLERILEAVDGWTGAGLPAGETVLLYFSGHGVALERESYLLPYDARWSGVAAILRKRALGLAELAEVLGGVRAAQRVVVLDCCRNAVRRGKGTGDNVRNPVQSKEVGLVLRAGTEATGGAVAASAVLFSCREGQRAYEAEGLGRGLFGAALEAELRGAGESEVK